jgi:hypothetical protein
MEEQALAAVVLYPARYAQINMGEFAKKVIESLKYFGRLVIGRMLLEHQRAEGRRER